MRILAIETSCDETAMALVDAKGGLKKPQFKVLKNIVLSQIKVHRPFGGVVPNLAKREHIKNLPKIFDQLMSYGPRPRVTVSPTHKLINSIDSIAVTVGPGLEPALWAGIEFAKSLINTDEHRRGSAPIKEPRKSARPELIGVNHMEGHLYSNVLKNIGIRFPAIALVVSGGHTILLKMDSLTKWKKLGETRDDAAGEAFDKVARMLNLPYPGGPEIQKIAKYGSPTSIDFPRPMLKDKNYDFSFSGLKTAVLYYLRDKFNMGTSDVPNIKRNFRTSDVQDVAASFQQAVVDVLVGKTIRAAREFGAESVLLCGGVAANKKLREILKLESEKFGAQFVCPDFEYNTDNAAMIAAAAYIQKLRGKKLKLEAQANLNL